MGKDSFLREFGSTSRNGLLDAQSEPLPIGKLCSHGWPRAASAFDLSQWKFGAPGGSRTPDRLITNQMLYQAELLRRNLRRQTQTLEPYIRTHLQLGHIDAQ